MYLLQSQITYSILEVAERGGEVKRTPLRKEREERGESYLLRKEREERGESYYGKDF